MATTLTVADLDFSTLKDAREPSEIAAAEAEILTKACPEHTARTLADPTYAKIAITGGTVGFLHGRLDAEAKQTQLSGVKRPSQIRSILRALGTDIRPPTAAVSDVTLRISGSLAANRDIPKYTTMRASKQGVDFVVTDDYARFPAGTNPMALVHVMQGEFLEERFDEASDGSSNFIIESIATDVLQNDTQRTISLYWGPLGGPEELWTWVDSFAESGPFDKHYRTERLSDGRMRFVHGDGQSGAIPTIDYRARATFISGGNLAGNVGVGDIDTLVTPILDSLGDQLSVTVSNSLEAEGGSDEQSLEQARRQAPIWWRTQDRAVTAEDYAALAKMVPGVLDAKARRATDSTSLSVVDLYIVGDSASGGVSSAVLSAVDEYVGDRKSYTDDLTVKVATLTEIDAAVLGRARRGTTPTAVKSAIDKVLGAADATLLVDARAGKSSALRELARYFFDIRARAVLGTPLFGDPDSVDGHAYYGDFVAIIEDTVGLANSDVTRFTRVPEAVFSLLRGTETISAIAISASTVAEEIGVRYTSATEYRVNGSVSGLMGFGEIGTVFTDENERVSFLSSGTPQYGDLAKFTISPLASNVRVDHEVYVAGTLSVEVV